MIKQNNFFQSSRHRSGCHPDRVGEMLAVIRKTMKKEGRLGKIVKKAERSFLKPEWDLKRTGIF